MKKNFLFGLIAMAVVSSASLVLGNTAYDNLVLSNNPVAYWPMQETTGPTIHDIAGGSYNGTLMTSTDGRVLGLNQHTNFATAGSGSTDGATYLLGGPGGLTGISGDTAIYFTNLNTSTNNSQIVIPYNAALDASNFSAEAWIKIPTYPIGYTSNNYQVALGFEANGGAQNGWWMNLETDGAGTNKGFFQFNAAKGLPTNGGGWNTETTGSAYSGWVHAVEVYTGSALQCYLNGVQVFNTNVTYCSEAIYGTHKLPFIIGSYCASYNTGTNILTGFERGNFWHGSVPHVAIYTNALTASQITNHYYAGTNSGVSAPSYNALWIPPTLSGTTFNLSLNQTNKQFFTNTTTTTYAFNNGNFWGPTLIMNKGDVVQINLTNNLSDTTTTHWHGFHIPAIMDGGPHELIPPGTTWSPTFTVLNNASTYWYDPHLHPQVQEQLTYGAGGFIIVQDTNESALALPRTYGVDDIPLALTSRRFNTVGTNAAFVTTNCEYGDYELVNGTMNAQVSLPKQYVRLRILDAEIERAYNLGFSDGRTFYVIATDGGLVNTPLPETNVVLSPGERVQILLNLAGNTVGSTLDLVAYNSSASLGGALGSHFPGSEPGTNGVTGSQLNNTNFNVLHINVVAATGSPITTLPSVLTTNVFWTTNDVTNTRFIEISTGGFGFVFNGESFALDFINQTVNLNAIEQWTVQNDSHVSHSFHMHDVQFYMISRQGGTGVIADYEQGWKDTCYVTGSATVNFIAKFSDFASAYNPFMFHCHFSDHEDGGMMGQYLVVNNDVEDLAISSFTRTGTNNNVLLQFQATPGTTYSLQFSTNLSIGNWAPIGSVTSDGSSANFTETNATRLALPSGFYRVAIPTNTY